MEALPGLGWLGDPQQRRDLLLDKWAPEIPAAHHWLNSAGSKAAAKPELPALSMGIGGDCRNCSLLAGKEGFLVFYILFPAFKLQHVIEE